jgi:UDP-N-acetylglucosamine 4-epimerase
MCIGDCNMDNYKLKFLQDSKFLVTGGAGFIGSNLVERILELGYQVRVLDNFSTGKEENIREFIGHSRFSLMKGDIRNIEDCQEACKNVDFILHQAALGSVPRSIEDPISTNDINISGTLNMMIAARDSNVKRFVYASSSSVYGDIEELPKNENRIGKPLSPYAISKLTVELYGKNFFDIFGLPAIGLRYFNVYGKRQDSNSMYAAVIPSFIKKLLNNEIPRIYGDGKQSRDFTYVENVVQANLRACIAEQEALGEVFNIGNEERITINDLYLKLCESLNIDIAPNYVSERAGDIKHSNADISKAKNILKYEPDYSFNEGLEKCIDWYKNHL